MTTKARNTLLIAIGSVILFQMCKIYVNEDFRKQYQSKNEILHVDSLSTTFYKLHFKNGDVAILESWQNTDLDSIIGTGSLYDFRRQEKKTGQLSFHVDEIAIGETNDQSLFVSKDKNRKTALAVLVAFNLALNVNCAINPKSCFGSCPTFYVEGNNDLRKCNAERFSHAITPSLASSDIDPLQHVSDGEHFKMTIKNEALETHVIDKVELLAAPKSIENQVLYSEEGYFECSIGISPQTAIVEQKDILEDIVQLDSKEYFNPTDSTDLFVQEDIVLSFENLETNKKGIVLNFRQSLLTTFLLYNSLSYLGDEVTDYIAQYERNSSLATRFFDPILNRSFVKIHAWDTERNKWIFIKNVYEIGPIAKNKLLISLPKKYENQKELKLKLTLPKGHWRIDYVAITNMLQKVEPVSLFPSHVKFNAWEKDELIHALQFKDDEKMITIPGDEALLEYELPCIQEGTNYELFVVSTGYYLEWMRKEWLVDKDLDSFKKMVMLDKDFWKKLAILYKEQEAESEDFFWNSNIKEAI